ncbi:oligosaccharide flippase family protein [Vibrio alginolyticus]|nr:oligosaccharide flippase family protein [Vibrio alginolyticus]
MKWKTIKENKFARNVITLASGTIISQGVLILALPLLTRLYSPEQFSDFSLFNSVLLLVGTIACFRMDIALPIAKEEKDADNVLILGLLFSFLVFILVLIICTLLISKDILSFNFIFLPFSIFFFGIFNLAQMSSTRDKKFKEISKARVLQNVTGSFIQVLLGFFSWSVNFGLMLGQSFVFIFGGGYLLLRSSFVNRIKKRKEFNIRGTFLKYKDYITYSTLEAALNSASTQLPVIIIALYYDELAGFILIAMKVMQIPLKLLGNSIGQVYLSEAPEHYNKGTIDSFATKVLKRLLYVGVLPISIIGLLSPFLFGIAFGSEWMESGEIALWMTPWFILQFLTSPLAMSFHITNNQKQAFYIQLLGFFLRNFSVFICVYYQISYVVEVFALSSAVFYFVYLYLCMRCVGVKGFYIKC